MNSQFKNSSFGSILYIGIIVIIALGLIIISWYMFAGYKIGTYSEDTILGSVYLGGLREEDIDERVYERIDLWSNDETVMFELTYQGYTYEFDRDLFDFNLELSKEILKDGETNELIAQYQDTGTDRADTIQEIKDLPYLLDVAENIDIEKLVNDILDDAGLMKTYSSKAVEDYLVDISLSQEDISSIFFHVPDGVDVDLMIQSIVTVYGDEYIVISKRELFDIVEKLGDNLNDAEMTIISSAMLELTLSTNFSIHEVHYRPYISSPYTITDYPFFGRNTSVNVVVNKSFSIYNPNDSDYMFRLEKVSGDTAEISLVGLPFVDTIEITRNKTQISFITQYTDNDGLIQNGSNGVIVVVDRTITNIYDVEIYKKDIIFEFYPPVTKITLEPIPE